VLVTDTVGFIKNLPHGLVASFKSTLDEALEASLIAHVVDASDPDWEQQLKVTEEVLDEIGANEAPRLIVFNKIDRAEVEAETASTLRLLHPGCVVMSAQRPEDVARLHAKIAGFFQKDLAEGELFVPWTAQKLRGEIFDHCLVLEERPEDEGTRFRVRAEPQALLRLSKRLT
jgi:GTP-binding protein HflX